MADIRPSTKRVPNAGTNRSHAYHAALKTKHDGEIIWICQHLHDNRDNDANHAAAARTCAEWVLHTLVESLGFPFVDLPEIKRHIATSPSPSWGLHLLADATQDQILWLQERAAKIRAGKVSNAGNRLAYPESWVEVHDGRYRGKLWEKEESDGSLLRRLFVAGPFGQDHYLEGHVDLNTHEVRLRGMASGAVVPLGWQEAAKRLEWTLPHWAPRSHSAQEEFHEAHLHLPDQRSAGSDLTVPAAYRIRVDPGPPRSYDIIEVNTGTVVESHGRRVPAYRRIEELHAEKRQVDPTLKSPETAFIDRFIYEAELWGKDLQCSHCHVELIQESAVWLVDRKDGWGGPSYCSQDCARQSLRQLDKSAVENEYEEQEE